MQVDYNQKTLPIGRIELFTGLSKSKTLKDYLGAIVIGLVFASPFIFEIIKEFK